MMVPVNEPLLNGNEKKYLNECIDSGWVSSDGPFIKRFESNMANYIGRKHATACSSGTAALDIAVKALNFSQGDEVIVPSFTIISCVQCLINFGLVPVLVDSSLDTFNMIVSDVEKKITHRTKAIMIVHIYGLTVDIDPIIKLAKKYNLRVIEDAAEMHGQEYKTKKCGSFGDISIFSFYPNKHITTGEGGMVLCDDDDLDARSKSLRNLCFGESRFIHHEIGFNYRMTNMQAAIGLAQLERIESIIKKKRWIGEKYNSLLQDLNMLNLPIKSTSYCKNIYWVYALTVKDGYHKKVTEITSELSSKNIGTRPFFYPMHKQPVFQEYGFFENINLPNSEALYQRGFYIPSGLALTDEQINEVSKCMHEVLTK